MPRALSESDTSARVPAWLEPPSDELPAVLPITKVVASTSNIAVALVGAHVYSTGVELQIELRARRLGEDDAGWERMQDIFFGRPGTPKAPGGKAALMFAVALDDGEEAMAGSPFRSRQPPDEPPQGLSVMTTRLGGWWPILDVIQPGALAMATARSEEARADCSMARGGHHRSAG